MRRPNCLDAIVAIDASARAGRQLEASERATEFRKQFGSELRDALAADGLLAPNVLLIGPARTGTTWLKHVLGDHPDIMMANGEPNMLWNVGQGGLLTALRWYSRGDIWRNWSNNPIITAEKSPGYITLSDNSISVFTKLFTDIKIISGNRNENARLWSAIHHQMQSIQFSGTWQDFCLIHSDMVAQKIDEGQTDRHLERWRLSIPNGHIIRYEFQEISRAPIETVNSIFHAIGVRKIEELEKPNRYAILKRIDVNPNASSTRPAPVEFHDLLVEKSRRY